MRALLATTIFGVGAQVGFTQPASQPGSSPAPAVVRLHVVAADADGRGVEGLQLSDFSIVDDGAARAIERVEFTRRDALAAGEILPIRSREDERAEAVKPGTRVIGVFLDDYHITEGPGAAAARDALVRFVTDGLGPRDLVAILRPLDSLLSIRATRDRAELRAAILASSGRKGDLEPRTAFEHEYFAGDPGRVDAARAQIAISAMGALATHLGGLAPSRKALVVVSEWFAAGTRRRGDVLPTVDGVLRAANRSQVAIYTIDPGALAAAPPRTTANGRGAEKRADASAAALDGGLPEGRDVLRRLANETGGDAMFSAADVRTGLRRLVQGVDAYYAVTFAGATDGRFHRIDVKVARPGVRVQAPGGYWAASRSEVARAEALAAQAAAPKPLPPLLRRASPLIRPWFGLSRATDGKTRVSFVWEPAGLATGARGAERLRPSRIELAVDRLDGTRVFDGTVVPPDAGATVDATNEATFDAPPGRLQVRMSISDASARVLDTDAREIVVGAFSGAVAFGTPRVLRARNARELRALDAAPLAPPVAARTFSRTERLLIRFPVYAPGGTPDVSASLSSRIGGAMRALAVRRLEGPDLYEVALPLAGLAAGDYSVEVTAASGGLSVKERVSFRVTP